MYSAEVISQLRTLNWLKQERSHLPPASAQAALLDDQERMLRERLPHSILAYHDSLAAKGMASVGELSGGVCGACHVKLPISVLAELKLPGRFAVCPHCGVFVWSAAADAAADAGRKGAGR